jgi:hypothetical protein
MSGFGSRQAVRILSAQALLRLGGKEKLYQASALVSKLNACCTGDKILGAGGVSLSIGFTEWNTSSILASPHFQGIVLAAMVFLA